MNRHDLHRRFALFDGKRLHRTLFVPPAQKQRNIGNAIGAKCNQLFMNGLQIGRMMLRMLQLVVHHDTFERIFGRQQPQRAKKGLFVFV